MSAKYSTIQQHQPLRTPAGWTADETRLIAQLEEILDDLYRRFNRLRLEDLGESLRRSIVSASDGVNTLSTRIEQNENSILLTAQVVNNILGGDVPVSSFESSTVAISAAGVHIKTGGVFTVDSGNFDLDEEGNVGIKNATISGDLSGTFSGSITGNVAGNFSGGVSGNLSSRGETALTGRDVIISTEEPLAATPGTLWVKPLANTTLTYKMTNAVIRSFEDFRTGVALQCQSAPVEATGDSSYRLLLPYRGLVEETAGLCTAIISLSNGTDSITLNETLLPGKAAFTIDKTFSDAAWLGSTNQIAMVVTLTGPDDVYQRYCIDPGAVTLICSSVQEEGALGWNDAEIKIFQ